MRRPKCTGSSSPRGRVGLAAVAIFVSLQMTNVSQLGKARSSQSAGLPLHCGDHVEANQQDKNERERDGIDVERETALRCGVFWHFVLRRFRVRFQAET